MGWTFIYLMLFLKLPILALLFLVWWAIRQSPDTDEDRHDGEGGGGGPRHPRPPLPRLPRRGPHGSPAPLSPQRVRHVTARGRQRALEP